MVEALGKSLNLVEILTLFTGKLAELVPFDACVLYLLDKSKQELVPRFASGADIDLLKKCRIPMGERDSGWAAYHKKAMIGRNDKRGRDRRERPFDWKELAPASPLRNLRSSLVVPLSNEEGESLGVLSFYASDDERFQEDHLRLVRVVSKHAAAAIRNALQYEESQEHALTDPLTTLPNARYLFVSFDEELTRASNLRIPLTIVELDVDNFKDINDVYGHLFGDKILRGIAKAIRTQLRGCDNCVRYAGDEFIVILPGVGREDIEYVERRLASCIEQVDFTPRPGKEVGVKISLGSATYPEEGNNFETLIGVADARMYAAKYRKKRESGAGGTAAAAPKGKKDRLKAG
jgi:diguanylate cyclase (GGDEF)-like protein